MTVNTKAVKSKESWVYLPDVRFSLTLSEKILVIRITLRKLSVGVDWRHVAGTRGLDEVYPLKAKKS